MGQVLDLAEATAKAGKVILKKVVETKPVTTRLRKKEEVTHGSPGSFVRAAMQNAIRKRNE